MGIEPTSSAWEAEVLPLNYTRRRPPCSDNSLFLHMRTGRNSGTWLNHLGPKRAGRWEVQNVVERPSSVPIDELRILKRSGSATAGLKC